MLGKKGELCELKLRVNYYILSNSVNKCYNRDIINIFEEQFVYKYYLIYLKKCIVKYICMLYNPCRTNLRF